VTAVNHLTIEYPVSQSLAFRIGSYNEIEVIPDLGGEAGYA